jgi:hypothetical protein
MHKFEMTKCPLDTHLLLSNCLRHNCDKATRHTFSINYKFVSEMQV